MWRHPKYYKELRKRNTEAVAKSGKSHASLESDQVISETTATANGERAPGPGLKPRYTPTGILLGVDLGDKPQASSDKHQASSAKLLKKQAASIKRQA